MTTTSAENGNTIIRKAQVLDLVGMRSTWLYAAMKRGEFPKSVRISANAVGWRKSEVLAWIAEREDACLYD